MENCRRGNDEHNWREGISPTEFELLGRDGFAIFR